jgi:hypothetical protein
MVIDARTGEGKGEEAMWNRFSANLARLALVLSALVLGFVVPQSVWAQANLENPTFGSFQSGIGVISGWKCTSGVLTFTIDNGPAVQLAYGTSRLDTE